MSGLHHLLHGANSPIQHDAVTINTRRIAGITVGIAALVGIAVATLTPVQGEAVRPWNACLFCGDLGSADTIVNVLLYLPLGIALALANVRPRTAVAMGLVLSTAIELTQLSLPGRDPSLRDILTNTLGTGLGILLVYRADRWLVPRHAAAWSLVAAAVAAAIVMATGWLLHPALPHGQYFGQWTPHHEHLEPYDGRVLTASLNGIPIPSKALARSAEVRASLLTGHLSVRAVAGHRLPALGSILSIACCSQTEVMLLGPDRDDLVFRYRTRGSGFGFDEPDIRFLGAMHGVSPGDTLDIAVWRASDGLCLSLNGRRRCGLGTTVGLGWGLLYYVESFPAWFKSLLSAAWVAGLALPFGLWARRHWLSLAGGLLLLVAFAAVGPMTGVQGTPPFQWLGVVGGGLLGLLTARRVSLAFTEAGGDIG